MTRRTQSLLAAGLLAAPIAILAGLYLAAPGLGPSLREALGLAAPKPANAQTQTGQAVGGRTVEGLFLAARAAELARDHEAALAYAERAMKLAPEDGELAALLFRQRVLAGRVAGASELAPILLAIRPDDGFANIVAAVMAMKRGDFAAAEAGFAKLGDASSSGIIRPFAEAWLRAAQKDYAGAREKLAAAKPGADDPFLPAWLGHDASIDELAGDAGAAEAKLRAALRGESQTPLRPVVLLAGLLARHGKADEAATLLKRYGETQAESVLIDPALVKDLAARPPSPTDMVAEVLFDVGAFIYGSGGGVGGAGGMRVERVEERALMFMRLALELRPGLDSARLLAAELHEALGQTSKAIENYDAVEARSPMKWRARIRSALALAEIDRVEDSIKALRTLSAERPERIDAVWSLGDLLSNQKRYAEAIVQLDDAARRIKQVEKRHWPLFYGRGIAHERVKDWPKAEADFLKALDLSPEQPYVLNYLGYTWVDHGVKLDQALDMLRRAVEARPDDGAITDSIGWAYYRLGQYDKAVEYLERAIQLKADDPTIVEHLGDAYWHVGRRREATFQWERALRQKPEPDRVIMIERRLKEGLTADLDQPPVLPAATPADGKPAKP